MARRASVGRSTYTLGVRFELTRLLYHGDVDWVRVTRLCVGDDGEQTESD